MSTTHVSCRNDNQKYVKILLMGKLEFEWCFFEMFKVGTKDKKKYVI